MKIEVIAIAMSIALSMPAQILQTHTYKTTGRPIEALATPDGQYILVTVDMEDPRSGIDIFRDIGGRLKRIAFQPLGFGRAQGIVLIPHTHMLAVGLSNSGVAFLPLQDALLGKATVTTLSQGTKPGSGYLVATPDGQFLFVANEYGNGGNVGIISLHPDRMGAVQPETLAHIPTHKTTPGLTISPDGSRVYVVSETTVEQDLTERRPGHGIAELQSSSCASESDLRAQLNGALFVIDVAKASKLTGTSTPGELRAAVKIIVDAGCSPVREAVTADGSEVYVTARGDNRVLVFDTKLLETDPQHAFLRAISTGGEAPVGLRLFDHDRALIVANSNRFTSAPGNARVFDLSEQRKPELRQTIRTSEFPRNITASSDGVTLYMTIFNGEELMVLKGKKGP